ncbi:hypothetical protein NUW54_g8568 [Trametes sanguinea]|uniref:Uncharacterized protein n=1 Tax=Trametes sanguinea TaxID=158606 RepID=A0ACC1PCI1_9APHY|nr:hypothetical protein NUW54_g8568 [Trametes sanguinea]
MSSPTEQPDAPIVQEASSNGGGFFSNILTPGSSLNPTFLLILDGAFGLLLVVLLSLFVITHWNIHLLFLMVIEGCLWASVKWFVHELQQVQAQEGASSPRVDAEEKNALKPKTE